MKITEYITDYIEHRQEVWRTNLESEKFAHVKGFSNVDSRLWNSKIRVWVWATSEWNTVLNFTEELVLNLAIEWEKSSLINEFNQWSTDSKLLLLMKPYSLRKGYGGSVFSNLW